MRALGIGALVLTLSTTVRAADPSDASPLPTNVVRDQPATDTSSASPAPASEIHTQLPNGLRFVIVRDPTVAEVSVEMMYAVGSGDDPSGYQGLAHLTEHMLFQASRHVPEDGFAHLLEQAGASYLNGATSFDDTSYVATVPAAQLPLALWLESERMAFAIERITPAAVDAQRRVVISEERWRRTDQGGSQIRPTLFDALFPAGHPYHHPFETVDDLGAIHATDVQWFLQRYYTPDNAVLAIVGNVDPEAARALVERYFGAIPRSDHPVTHVRLAPVVTPTTEFVEFDMPYLTRRVIVAWHTPPLFDRDDAALRLVARMLNDRSGRFQRTVRAHHPTLGRIEVEQDGHSRGALFTITFTASSLDSSADLFPDLLATLTDLRQPNAYDVEGARNAFRRWHATADPLNTRADGVCNIAWSDDPTRTEETTRQRYDALSVRDVKNAVERWLSPEHATVFYTVPNGRAPREGTRMSPTLHTLHVGGR